LVAVGAKSLQPVKENLEKNWTFSEKFSATVVSRYHDSQNIQLKKIAPNYIQKIDYICELQVILHPFEKRNLI
jgi:hypothetical protein